MSEPWDVKLARAHEHLSVLRRAIDDLTDSGDFAVTTERSGRERAVRLVVRGAPPGRLSAIVGDFVHNLRSALDCVMLAACEQGGPLTEAQERAVQFPITSTPAEYEGQKGRIKSAPSEVRDAVCEMQPWYWAVRKSTPPADDDQLRAIVQHDQLTTINHLSNVDKHRRIHLTTWYAEDIYTGSPDGVTVGWRHATVAERSTGLVGHWVVDGDNAESVVMSGYGRAALTLQRYVDLDWHNVELTGILQGHLQHVEWVVGTLAVRIGRR